MTTQHYEEWQKNETDRIHRQTKIKEAAQQLQNKQMMVPIVEALRSKKQEAGQLKHSLDKEETNAEKLHQNRLFIRKELEFFKKSYWIRKTAGRSSCFWTVKTSR